MKKIAVFALILVFTFSSAACGHASNNNNKQTPSPDTASTTAGQKETGGTNAPASQTTGKTVYNGTEGLTLNPVYENAAVNISKETGPIKYTINGIQVAQSTVTDEEIAGEMELLPGQEFTTVAFDVTIENTSDEPSSIYFTESSPSLTTNTEKDILPDMWLSDSISEDYEPHETKTGVIVFALLHSKAGDINSIRMTVSAPYNTVTYEDAGEESTVDYSW